MAWKFDNSSPIYMQIMEYIKMKISRGDLKPGDKIPTVRDMALEAGVNPNTMQKALAELEREGILYSNRTEGRYVSDLNEKNIDVRSQAAEKYVKTYIVNMKNLGFDNNQIIEKTKEYL